MSRLRPTSRRVPWHPGRIALLAVMITIGAALVGLPGHTERASAAPAVAATTGPNTTVTFSSGRQYVYHTPPPHAGVRWPLVIVLHGLDNTWATAAASGNWSTFADAHHFGLAYGVGLSSSWNAGLCCGQSAASGVDDVSYLVSVADDVQATRTEVDPHRVYVVGFSNGDMMALRAECERPDFFAAAGGAGGDLTSGCRSTRQVRYRHLHGLADGTVPYQGGTVTIGGKQMTLPPVATIPSLVAVQSPNPIVAVTAYPDAGHAWPRLDNAFKVDGTALIWSWISAYRVPLIVPGSLPDPVRPAPPVIQPRAPADGA
ncbi:MAG: poly(3-hydroxybutyrate) depolymerase [Actinobacteria bacterium]|nr:poly(3-hydroxybutyrate) depolymerase [Actinomycetota bacterium]